MNLEISKIKVGERFRKDMGDLEPLKRSISEIGLLHPIVVDENNNLIAGARRLECFKQLGHKEILVNKISIKNAVKGERDENVVRKDFTPSEAVAIYGAMENYQGQLVCKIHTSEKRQNRAAKIIGMSQASLSHAKQVVESGRKELIRDMDRTGNVNRAYRYLQRAKDEDAVKTIPKQPINGKFRTIVIDPPWEYDENILGRTKPTYALLSIEELEKLNMMKFAEDTCHLYLWTTNAFIWKAVELGKKWGFQYKTLITWVKPTIGLGSYFRNSTEHCLFFIKEGSKSTRAKDIPTHFLAPRGEHSEKPDTFYGIVERASYPPFLDFFARKERKGWAVFGNVEAPK